MTVTLIVHADAGDVRLSTEQATALAIIGEERPVTVATWTSAGMGYIDHLVLDQLRSLALVRVDHNPGGERPTIALTTRGRSVADSLAGWC